jgi:hypothetical protein
VISTVYFQSYKKQCSQLCQLFKLFNHITFKET